jgi:hypothetical protein
MFQNPNNFTRCPRCKSLLINEEYSIHSCFRIRHILVDSSNPKRIWVSDGKEWYRWFQPTESQQRNKTPDDSTEPIFII